MVSYMFRHDVFSFTAIKYRKEDFSGATQVRCRLFSVSILIPAHDEEKVIGRLLQRIVELRYPRDMLEVIVINDCSKDKTGQIVETYASMYPSFIKVINREEGGNGKAEALNEGLLHAKGEIIGCFDADYFPQIDFLEKLLPHFLEPHVGVVQSRIYPLNENESWISRIVMLERIGGYRVSQYAREKLGLVPQYGGTAGLIRRDLLINFGGFNPNILAEDTDLTFKVRLAGYKVKYVNYAEVGEEAPAKLSQYWHQRNRWATGHMQCAFKYALPLLKSKKTSLKQKIDGLMILNMYFLPVFVLLSWFLLFALFVLSPPTLLPYWVALVVAVFFALNGNVAPFLEVVAGVVCDRRKKLLLFAPLLAIAYVINVFVCSEAFLYLAFAKLMGRNVNHWHKTTHNGLISQ
jgi:cellulose synthase/poly-beta-1,6-N-acetylglucosamine synthase-like glycosyltransferase